MRRVDVIPLVMFMNEKWGSILYPLPTTEEQWELRARVWLEHLSDVDAEIVHAAVLAMPGEFAPNVSQVRAAALRLSSNNPAPDPDEMLAEVWATIAKVGYVGTPTWSHPAVEAAIAAVGGWLEVCKSDNPEAMRAHLRQAYATAAQRTTNSTPPLVSQLVSSPPTRELGDRDPVRVSDVISLPPGRQT